MGEAEGSECCCLIDPDHGVQLSASVVSFDAKHFSSLLFIPPDAFILRLRPQGCIMYCVGYVKTHRSQTLLAFLFFFLSFSFLFCFSVFFFFLFFLLFVSFLYFYEGRFPDGLESWDFAAVARSHWLPPAASRPANGGLMFDSADLFYFSFSFLSSTHSFRP